MYHIDKNSLDSDFPLLLICLLDRCRGWWGFQLAQGAL